MTWRPWSSGRTEQLLLEPCRTTGSEPLRLVSREDQASTPAVMSGCPFLSVPARSASMMTVERTATNRRVADRRIRRVSPRTGRIAKRPASTVPSTLPDTSSTSRGNMAVTVVPAPNLAAVPHTVSLLRDRVFPTRAGLFQPGPAVRRPLSSRLVA